MLNLKSLIVGLLSASCLNMFAVLPERNCVSKESLNLWKIFPDGGKYGKAVTNKDGVYVLQLHSDTDAINPMWKMENLEFSSDRVYAFRVKLKAEKGVAYRVYVESAEGGIYENIGVDGVGSGEWQEVTKEFALRQTTRNAIFLVGVGGPGSLDIAEVSVSEVPGKSPEALRNEHQKRSMDVRLRNGDFESGSSSWKLGGGAEVSVDPDDAGNHVLKVSSTDISNVTTVVHGLVPVDPATSYQISYRVRGIKGKGDENAFHWFRVYAAPEGDSKPSSDDSYQSSFDSWQHKTVDFQTTARQKAVRVAIDVRGPAEVLIDDVQLKKIEEPTFPAKLELSFPLSYRNGVFTSHPESEIQGQVVFNSEEVSRIKVLYEDGENKRIGEKEFDKGQSALDFSFPAPKAGTTNRLALLALDGSGKVIYETFESIYGFAANPAEVTFNRNKVALVNGKKFFPIGHTQTTHRGDFEFELEFFKEAGFNTLLMEGTSKTLDILQKYDLMMIRQVPQKISSDGTEAENSRTRELFAEDLVKISKHPALLAYFGADEPAWAGAPLESMTEVYEMIKKWDPYHPVYVNEAPVVNSMSALKTYAKIADVYGIDIYPVPEGSMHGSLDRNRTLSSVGDYVDICHQIVDFRKPVWMILQSFAWAQCHNPDLPPEKAVYPTWEQSRFMAYQAIAHGATGIIYHYLPYGRVLSEQFWKDLRHVTLELSYMSPVFVGDTVHGGAQVDNDRVRLLQKKGEKGDVYILVNEANTEQSLQLSGIEPSDTQLKVLLDLREPVSVKGGKLSLTMKPYEVIVLSSEGFSSREKIYHDETYTPYNVELPTLGERDIQK